MPRVELRGGLIEVETRYTEKELIKSLPGSRWDKDGRTWTMPLSWAACLQLRGAFGDALTVGPELALWSQREMTRRIGPATELRSMIARVGHPSVPYDEKLYDFQTAGARFMEIIGGGLLGDDMGMGKTPQLLAVIRSLVESGDDACVPALVICPNSVKLAWKLQAQRWKTPVNCYPLVGGAATRRKTLEAARSDPTALVTVNIEAVRLLSRLAPYGSLRLARCRECDPRHGEETLTAARCEVHPKPLNGFGFGTVILDEAHRIKDPRSKQTRACWAVGHDPSVRYRFAATGTPVAEHVGDLWSIMHFVAPSDFPSGRSKFIDLYGLQAWNAHGGLDVVGINPAKRDEFYRILDSRFRRTPKALVLDQLPKVVRPTRWVDMTPKQARAYEELDRRLATMLDNGDVLVSANNLVRNTRLLQLASSYAEVDYVPDPTEDDPDHVKIAVRLVEPSSKLDAMEEDVEALGGRGVVIAAQSRQLIELAARRFDKSKLPYAMIVGGMDEYDRQLAVRRLAQGSVRAVLVTIDAAGEGVDGLQEGADTMLVLQRSWKMIANIQLDGRLDRIGSERHSSVTVVDYVTRGTVEETKLFPRLQEKWDRLAEITRDRQRLAAAGKDTSEFLFNLDRRESEIVHSFLGA